MLDVVDVALYTRHWVRHSPFNGQFGFDLQLHLRLMPLFVLFSTLELRCLMMFPTLLVQQLLSFKVFSLKILCYFLFLGKCFLTSLMKSSPIFVFTFWLYGGLNHITFLFLFLRAFWVLLFLWDIDEKCPLSFTADSLTLSHPSLFQGKSEILLLIILGNCLMIAGGWFRKALM